MPEMKTDNRHVGGLNNYLYKKPFNYLKMKNYQNAVRTLMAATIILGVQTTASAQLGGLMKKAKKAVKSQVENKVKMSKFEAQSAANDALDKATGKVSGNSGDDSSSSSTSSSSSSSAAKHPKSLKDLDSKLFIYSPTNNPDFYDVNNANVTKGYVDFCNTANRTESEGRHVPYEQLDFVDYQTSAGMKQVHITEYSFTAYYSYFMTNPKEVSGYQCYIRARLMQDIYRFDRVCVFPYAPHPKQGWVEVYPGAKDLRKITLKSGKAISLLETENQRQKRWDDVQSEAEDILLANTPYNVVRSVLKGTLEAIKQCDAAGRSADACNLLREAGYMMQDLASHPLHNKDEQFQGIYEDYNNYFTNKRLTWLRAAGAQSAVAVDMPKAVSVSSALQTQATAKAKAKFGSKFVKAIFTESEWHVYKEPEWPNKISHRSMDVDVIIKEGKDYFVSHQCLWQNYSGGKYTNYDMRNRMVTPIQQKVNYK